MKKHIKKITTVCSLVLAWSFLLISLNEPVQALAQCTGNDTAICQANENLIDGILKNVINIMLYLAGIIAVIMIVVGGLRYITSDGDSSKANQGKNTIIYACVGLVVAVSAYSIVNFVIGKI